MLNYWVSFNSKRPIFFPNTQATATVYLETDRTLNARKIDIRVSGIAKTYWNEYYTYFDCNNQARTDTIPYGAEVVYINAYRILWSSQDGTNRLPPGKYQFPFIFDIPLNAPPCIGGGYEYGSMTYRVRTNIDIPWATDEERFCSFAVYPLVDLNLNPQLAQTAFTIGTEVESKCCSCSSYPCNVEVSIPKSGYIPGETIQLNIKIVNTTSWKIAKIEYGIVENLVFTGYTSSAWGGTGSMVKSSSNEVISKQVEVRVCTDAVFSSGPTVSFPLTIGSVAIRNPAAS
uniref:Arrestin C-terminal-like domain-containing protein n=1 Tax=Panagrolaimus davidi TaxID=227884 RepID=A0A914P6Z7_9BILA